MRRILELVVVVAIGSLGWSGAVDATVECDGTPIVPVFGVAGYPLLSPSAPGVCKATRREDFLALLADLEQAGSTRTLEIEGAEHQLPPWFDRGRIANAVSTCGEEWLHRGPGDSLTHPTLDPPDYLVVTDQFSELALLTALGCDGEAMRAVFNTIRALFDEDVDGAIAPRCWIGRVRSNQAGELALECHEGAADSATDATVRVGLALYAAARNGAFPAAERAGYLDYAHRLAAAHSSLEYKHFEPPGCKWTSTSGTARELCDLVATGANAANGSQVTMYSGYYQDVVKFLLAAYAASGASEYRQRAAEVVDQYLLAAEFDATALVLGRKCFEWDLAGAVPRPMSVAFDDCSYWWQGTNAWDAADAPRALWMGDVFRAHQLATEGAPLPPAYVLLADWVGRVLASSPPTQTATCSCTQYDVNGMGVAQGNCQGGHFYNGLGLGLLTYLGEGTSPPGVVETKLDTALGHYFWHRGRWDDQGVEQPDGSDVGCFFLYDGVRTVKALAAAIGLDAATFGFCPPSRSFASQVVGPGAYRAGDHIAVGMGTVVDGASAPVALAAGRLISFESDSRLAGSVEIAVGADPCVVDHCAGIVVAPGCRDAAAAGAAG